LTFNIRNFLNKLKWDPRENPENYIIEYISRGAPNDKEIIRASSITKVFHRGFEYKAPYGKIKYIPFHRILLIKNVSTDRIIYRKRMH